jgi:glycosyltransferase involved in cell wall biosynthesis
MRILISSLVDLTHSAHSRLHDFVSHLSRNHQVTILSIKDWWKSQQTDVDAYNEGFEDVLNRINIRYLTNRRVSPVLQEVFSILAIHNLLEDKHSFDVHFNYGTPITGFLVTRKMRALGVGTVYDYADDLPGLVRTSPQIPKALRPLGGGLAQLMVRCNVMLSKRVTLTTDALDLPRSFQEKYVVLPNGVDTALFKRQDSSELRKRLGIDDDFVLGYVGVLREWVDLEPVVSALAILRNEGRNVRLLVVGEEGGLQRPKALANRYEVSESVIFTGTIPYPRVPWYISCMDVGLIPFIRNPTTVGALPLKLWEYMACQVPVLSTRLPGIELAVGNRVLYAATADEIVSVVKILQHEGSERWSVESRRFVEENYGLRAICSRLECILADVSRALVQGLGPDT